MVLLTLTDGKVQRKSDATYANAIASVNRPQNNRNM